MPTGVALLGLLLFAFKLQSALILSDTFSYPDGPITNQVGSPWVTHSSNSTNEEILVTGGRAYLSFTRGDDVHASLTNQPYTPGNGVVLYFSLNVNFSASPTESGSYFAHFKDGGNGYRARVWASTSGAPAGLFRLGIGNGTGATASSGQLTNNLALNATYILVVRYNVAKGVSTIWLNPASESDPSETAADPPGPITLTSFAFRQSSGMGTLFVDDLKVGTSFADVVVASSQPPTITSQPQSQTVSQGANVTFTVGAAGTPPLSFQWQFNSTNLASATNSVLELTNVTAAQAGLYMVRVTNSLGFTNSETATLTVNRPSTPGFSLLTYNVKGNGATDWSTNSSQVQAIARQLQFLNPDIITFQEIPYDLSYEMTNFVSAFLPGYTLARNSGTDGAIRGVVASRFPITRSTSWLDGIDLRGFGYSNANNSLDNFTRDLFEAQINVPGFARPLHVFTTHLKSTSGTTYEDAADKRAAEATAITNFFATNLLTLYVNDPYVLTGDLNDSDTNALAVQYLISEPSGLLLTNPKNPFTGSINTFSAQGSLSSRLDFIFPGGLLRSNIAGSQVFRTDLLPNPPPPLLVTDSAVASDHLPVLMLFNNPYDKRFRLLSFTLSNQTVTLMWESVPGQPYRLESSSNLAAWSVLVPNLTASGLNQIFTTNVTGNQQFFRVFRVPQRVRSQTWDGE